VTSALPSDRLALARRVYERSRLTGEFRLRSGAVSGEYFDKYLFESDPRLLRALFTMSQLRQSVGSGSSGG
jgi:orotate phosphoribosyltransferase